MIGMSDLPLYPQRKYITALLTSQLRRMPVHELPVQSLANMAAVTLRFLILCVTAGGHTLFKVS